MIATARLSGLVRAARLEAPTELDFGEVEVGATVHQPLVLRSVGRLELRVDAVVASLPFVSHHDFNTLSSEGTVLIDLTPAEPGLIRGSVQISTNDPDHPIWTVALTAQVR